MMAEYRLKPEPQTSNFLGGVAQSQVENLRHLIETHTPSAKVRQ
jgi:hypothetical protein